MGSLRVDIVSIRRAALALALVASSLTACVVEPSTHTDEGNVAEAMANLSTATLSFPVNGGFNPDPLDVSPGEEITLKYLGGGSAEVTIYDSNNNPYPLFKGSSNPYSASSDDTWYQIADDAPEDSTYTIVYNDRAQGGGLVPGPALVAVRGTVNVKKPSLF